MIKEFEKLPLSAREFLILNKRFNIKGDGNYTLNSIGKELNLTRERVRQIQNECSSTAIETISKDSKLSSYLESIDIWVENSGLILLRKDIYVTGVNKGIQDFLISISKTISTYKDLIFSSKLSYDDIVATEKKIIKIIKKSKHGINIEDLIFIYILDKKSVIPIKGVRNIISFSKNILNKKGFLTLSKWIPKNAGMKAVEILRENKKPMRLDEIYKKFKERFPEKETALETIRGALIACDKSSCIGQSEYALTEWGYSNMSTTELVEKILKENERMRTSDLVKLIKKHKNIKTDSIRMALRRSDKIERIGRSFYKFNSQK